MKIFQPLLWRLEEEVGEVGVGWVGLHLVGEVAVIVAGIDVAHEALLPLALWTGDFPRVPSRQFPGLKLVTIICIHLSIYDLIIYHLPFVWLFLFVLLFDRFLLAILVCCWSHYIYVWLQQQTKILSRIRGSKLCCWSPESCHRLQQQLRLSAIW